MYGHQFYQVKQSKRILFLNNELKLGHSLEAIALSMFIDIDDMLETLKEEHYYYVKELNRFVKIEMDNVA